MLNKYLGTLYENNLVTDILKRVYFSEEFSRSNLVENYFIEDGDTPESISYSLYGKPEYCWFILNLNVIVNKFDEWPITQNILHESIQNKYPTSSIIINPTTLKNNNINLSNIKYIKDSSGSISYQIKNYDKNFSKLITNEKINDLFKSTLDSEIKIYNKNNVLVLYLTNDYRIVYDDAFSVHHFENNNEPVGSYIESYYNGPTYLESYASGLSEQFVITNYQYELIRNDDKRNIVLIRPEYIEQVVRQFRKIMTGINKSQNILEIPANTMSSLLD